MAPSQADQHHAASAPCLPLCGSSRTSDAVYTMLGPPVVVKAEAGAGSSSGKGAAAGLQERERVVYQLSAFDHSLPILGCINPKAFLFRYPLEGPRLRRALALTLAQYPLLAGRIHRYSRRQLRSLPAQLPYHVRCCNSGVPVSEASCTLPSSAFSLAAQVRRGFSFNYYNRHFLPEYMQDLDVRRMLRGQEPPCKVQLTHLADGATILAISTSHALLDGRSFAMFINCLAAHYKELGPGPGMGPSAGLGAGAGAGLQQQQAAGAAGGKQATGVVAPVVDRSLLLPGNVPRSLPAASSTSTSTSSIGTSSGSSEQLMQQLSLHTQQVEQRPPVGRILRNLWRATSGTVSENWRYPNLTFDLTTEVLHIPQHQVAALKALAAGSSGCGSSRGDGVASAAPSTPSAAGSSIRAEPGIPGVAFATLGAPGETTAAGAAAGAAGGAADFISTNDAVAGLFWTAMCQLRGRPLPGSSPQAGSHALGLAVDLRHNGLKGHLPPSYFGNAVWALYVDSHKDSSGSDSGSDAAGAAGQEQQEQQQEGSYVGVLRQAARRVRGSLQRFRSSPEAGHTVVDLAYRQHVASTRQSADVLSRLYLAQDAFLTSWQFPYWGADFGAGGPARYHGVVRPLPPWQAAVMTAHPDDGGLYLFVTVPSSAVAALKASPVLHELAPDAYFPSDRQQAVE